MSGVVQKRKGPKSKQLICTNGARFQTLAEANMYIEKLRNKGQRGSVTLHAFKCHNCSNKQGEVIHVGQRKRTR